MTKFTCIVDTSSYINLTKYEFNQGTLLDRLIKNSAVKLSPYVNSAEIENHTNDNIPPIERRINHVYHPKKRSIAVYEQILFGEILKNGAPNKGEKDSIAILLDILLTSNQRTCLVFLTDDYQSLRGCLHSVNKSLPFYIIWNSYDVVLYLYMFDKVFTESVAKEALKELHKITSTNDPNMDPKKNNKRIKMLRSYITSIECIANLKK